jgi:O-antigen ligase
VTSAVERPVLLGASGRAPGLGTRAPANPSAFVFWGLLVFMVLEYVRPAGVTQLKLQMLYILLVPVLWLRLAPRPWSRNLTLQFALLAHACVSVFYAYNYFSAYMRTRVLFGSFAVALAITWALTTRRNFERAVWFWVAIMGYQAFYSLGNAGRGAGGFIGDENDLALAVATAFPFAYAGILYGNRRVICLLLAALYSAAIVVSFSRGGFLGLVAGVLYCVLMGTNRVRKIAIGLVAGAIFYLALPAHYKAELETIQDTDSGTSEVRFFLWQAATNMWKDHPVLGVGAGNSPWHMGRYQPRGVQGSLYQERMYQERDWSGTVVHSLYFEMLAEMGLVGIALYAAIVYGHFTGLRRLRLDVARDPRASPELRRTVELYATALGGAVVAFLAAGAFLAVLYYPYVWYFSAMTVALDRWVRGELAATALPSATN